MVRAKFRVHNIEKLSDSVSTIWMCPVTDGSPENKEFFTWTPSGTIQLQCCNPTATAQLELNREYYVDFTKAN